MTVTARTVFRLRQHLQASCCRNRLVRELVRLGRMHEFMKTPGGWGGRLVEVRVYVKRQLREAVREVRIRSDVTVMIVQVRNYKQF